MDIVLNLSWMFLLLTIFSLPLFYIYSQGTIFSETVLAKYYLGNMGGATVFCNQYRLGRGVAHLTCPTGTLIDTRQVVFGVMNSEFLEFTSCTQKAVDLQLDSSD